MPPYGPHPFIPDFAVQNPPRSESEGLRGQNRREFGQLCRVTQILQLHKIVLLQNPGLPRKADPVLPVPSGNEGTGQGKSSSDLSHDPNSPSPIFFGERRIRGANFAIAKFGFINDVLQSNRRISL
jgi:hypothetical protein